MHNKGLCRSFLLMWDMMIITRYDQNIPISTYNGYRDGACALFLQLFNREMDYPYEIEIGKVY